MSRSSIESAASDWVARHDAGLTAAEEVEFAAWLQEPAHARAFNRHESAFHFFGRSNQNSDGLAIAKEIRRRIALRRKQTAGVVVLVILAMAAFWQVGYHRPSDYISSNAVVVRPEQRLLPDGSVVELRPGTEIATEFSATGSGPRRIRMLRGEALFHVAKNRDRPFVVAVGPVDIRAVGTSFSVKRVDAKVEVVVTQGVVALDQRFAQGVASARVPATVATLNAGERAEVDSSGANLSPKIQPLTSEDVADRLSWREPRLEFTGTPLTEAVRLVNELNAKKFEIGDPAIRSLEVSGFIRANNPETFLLLLEQGLGVRGEYRGDVIVLRKAH